MNLHYRTFVVLVALIFPIIGSAADNPAVVARAGETKISAGELAAEFEMLEQGAKQQLSSSTDTRYKYVSAFLIRRQVANRARAEGVADEPAVRNRLRLLEDRFLYQEYMRRAEQKAVADDSAIEALAHEEYRAFRDKFFSPERVRVSHILLRLEDERDVDQVRALADELLERARAGEDFGALANIYSEDRGSAVNGGDLGFFERGRMVEPFEDAAFALTEPGQLSPIVETEFGFHIIRLTERREAGIQPFDEVKEGLIESNRENLKRRVRAEITAPLRDPTKIEIDDAALQRIFTVE